MSWYAGGGGARARLGLLDVLVAAVAPGLPTLRRRRGHGAVLLLAGVVGPLVWLVVTVLRHGSWIELGLDRAFLGQLILVIAIAVIARLAGVGEVLAAGSTDGRSRLRGAVAFATLLAVTVPSAVGVAAAAEARADIDRAFGDESEAPIFDASERTPTEPSTTTTTTTTAAPTVSNAPPTTLHPSQTVPHEVVPEPDPRKPLRPDSGVDPALLSDITTILLIGGDAGPGRSGLRTDSMILVSIHRPSGRVALISVPRNLEHILFPPDSALGQRYPYGFDDIANAVYPRVSSHEELRDAYRVDGLRPGAVATVQTLGYSLDVTDRRLRARRHAGVPRGRRRDGRGDGERPQGGAHTGQPARSEAPGARRHRGRRPAHGRHHGARVRPQPKGRQRLPAHASSARRARLRSPRRSPSAMR